MATYYPLILSGTSIRELAANDSLNGSSLVSSLTVSGDFVCSTLSATHSLSANGMPFPVPYMWASAAAGTEDSSERNFGHGAMVNASAFSNTSHISWDDTNKQFLVNATGSYQVTFIGYLSTGSNQDVTLKLYVGGVEKHKLATRVTTQVDPHLMILDFIGPATAGDSVYVTKNTGSNSRLSEGSTCSIRRIS